MTCVIGLVDGDNVWIGADSAASDGWSIRESCLSKVFCVDDFLIGYTTSFRMGQLLQWELEVKRQPEGMGDEHYMVSMFAEAVRDLLKEKGFAKEDNSVETGGEFLVGYRGCLYNVCPDFQVNSYRDGFDAIGCGEPFALGAMRALVGRPPKRRVLAALEVAEHFSGGVRGPFSVLCMPGEEQ